MDRRNISQDDFMDVMEMTSKIESYLHELLKDNDRNIAFSALIGAFINYMLGQCKTLDEVVFYRNLFMKILDNSIRTIRIQGP
jgi:DNA-binding phage protein